MVRNGALGSACSSLSLTSERARCQGRHWSDDYRASTCRAVQTCGSTVVRAWLGDGGGQRPLRPRQGLAAVCADGLSGHPHRPGLDSRRLARVATRAHRNLQDGALRRTPVKRPGGKCRAARGLGRDAGRTGRPPLASGSGIPAPQLDRRALTRRLIASLERARAARAWVATKGRVGET